MKAVIVEIKGNYAAVLSDDGCISKVINKNYAIGQVIELNTSKGKFKFASRKAIAMAASLVAVFTMFSVTAWAYCTPYYYVSLDVNPSIEYSVNRFERVIGVKAVNEDGTKVLEKLNLQNQSIDDAIQNTIEQITTQGYLNESEQGGICIAAYGTSEENSQGIAGRIRDRIQECIDKEGIEADIEANGIGQQRVQRAEELNTTPGKLNLVEKLQASSEDPGSIVVSEWLDKPVKEIMKAIKENNKSDNSNSSNKDTNGNSNQSDNANTSNSSSNGSSNKSDNADSSISNSNSSSNKSDNDNSSISNSNSNSNKSDNSNKNVNHHTPVMPTKAAQ